MGWGKAWHLPGPKTTTAREFIGDAFKMVGHEPDVKESLGVAMGALDRFTKGAKEEKELMYMFLRPPILDGTAWQRTFGPPPATNYERGLRATVQWWQRRLEAP